MKKQVVVMHGGDYKEPTKRFLSRLAKEEVGKEWFKKSKGWKSTIESALGDNFEVFAPQMPNRENAEYPAWKIWFEKLVPFLNDGVILIGHSLGAIFFAKYLSENLFPNKIKGVFLLAGPYREKRKFRRDPIDGFVLKPDLSLISRQTNNVVIYHSKDDPLVPVNEARQYKEKLPEASLVIFENKGHFSSETFPEIIEAIQKLG